MEGFFAVLSSIIDVAVNASSHHRLLVATEPGRVHLLEDPSAAPTRSWDCDGGPMLRVGWIGDQPIAWNADQTSHTLWILAASGDPSPHPIPVNADVAVCYDGVYVAAGGLRLTYGELSGDGTIAWIDAGLAPLGGYERETLTASPSGGVAVLSGSHLQFRTSARKSWQSAPSHGSAIAISPSGRRLASAVFHEHGSIVHVRSTDQAIEPEAQHSIPALPERITTIQWGRAGRSMMVFARNERDVRVFSTDNWHPGLWTQSSITPRFYPPGGVVTVPVTRDRLLVHSLHGETHKTWTRVLSSVEGTFKLSGIALRRRGDKVVVFEKRPTTRPTAIYEIVDGPRKDDETGERPNVALTCRLRVAFPPPTEDASRREAENLATLASKDGAELDAAWIRELLERLFAEHPSELESLRVQLTTASSNEGSTVVASEPALKPSIDPRRNEPPSEQGWTRRWWRFPGESLIAEQAGQTPLTVNLAWVNATEWGLKIRIGTREIEAFFDLGPEHLESDVELPREALDALRTQLAARRRGLPSAKTSAEHPIISSISKHLRKQEWTSGKRLRHELNLDIDSFRRSMSPLVPRYVRKSSLNEADEYSLTIPGVLAAGDILGGASVMEALFQAIAHRANQDPEASHFDAADLIQHNVDEAQLPYAKIIARVAFLVGAQDESQSVKSFALPADSEPIKEARGKGLSFSEYILHAANERHRNQHFVVHRPWATAPLWIDRDGSQPDYPPIGFLWSMTPREQPDHSPSAADMVQSDVEAAFEIDGYEILETLPAGASGEVYRARENRPGGVERAIKVFIPHPFADDQDPEPRFRSEADALLRLRHRAIVSYVHSGVLKSRGAFYLVMDFVKGERLRNRSHSMPFEQRVATMVEILNGLEHVHQNKIFHRDIKPTNIMIRESDDQPVLVDFGLAYLLGEEANDDRTRSPPGTPGYIAPEAANDPKRSRDPRNDVFQAGATLYEILVGHLPGDPYLDLEMTDARLRDLDPIVRRALESDPSNRFPSARAFADALKAWLERDARRRVATRSAVTDRLASHFSERIKQAETEQAAKEREQSAINDAVKPIALTIEALAVEAFKELHDAIDNAASYMTVHNMDPFVGADEKGTKLFDSPLVWFEYLKMKHTLGFIRVRPGVDLWSVAKDQLRPLVSRQGDAPRRLSQVWVISSDGSQSPPQSVWGAVAIEVVRTAPTVELRLLTVRRHSESMTAIESEELVKEHILECLGEALHVPDVA